MVNTAEVNPSSTTSTVPSLPTDNAVGNLELVTRFDHPNSLFRIRIDAQPMLLLKR